MSYLLLESGKRVMDSYPPEATCIDGVEYDGEKPGWKAIPRNADLSMWIRIVPWNRRTPVVREYRVFYEEKIRPPPRTNSPWSLTFYLYGFIENMNLSLTGDWDSSENNASKAQQYIRINAGPCPDAFHAQGDTLSVLEQHVIGTLRGGGLPVHEQDAMVRARKKVLKISRRVFEKVTTTSPASLPISGPAVDIVNKWRITGTSKLGLRRDDSKVLACTAAKLAPGDFVQVQTKLVIVAKDSKQGSPREVHVYLNLVSVVRLVAARHVPQVMPVAPSKVASKNIVDEGRVVYSENIEDGPNML